MNVRRSVLLWLFYSALIAVPFLTNHEMPGTREFSWTGALLIGGLVGLVWLLVTALIMHVTRRFPFRRGHSLKPALAHLAQLILFAVLMSVAFAAAAFIVTGGLATGVDSVIWSSAELTLIAYPSIAFVSHILDSRARTQTAELQLAHAHAVAAEAKLHALRAQLQPHFLFNALNTVAMAVRRADRQEALAVVLDLSALLRTALKRTGTELVSLTEEIDFIKQYLEIEQIRFRDRLHVDWDVDPAAHDAAVPSMILQPLAENALRHGIGKKVKGGHLRIRIAKADGRLDITIEDDGPGFPTDWTPGVGLANVQNRLALHFGERASLATSNGERGASVRLSIPYSSMNGDGKVYAADR
ncbi:MAG TPA: histidine kinase [Longimicrobiales bacterium]